MRIILVLSVLLTTSLSITAVAAEPSTPVSDARITSVVSGGHWQDDDLQGLYRVVLWTEGFEHVSSGVVAEWIAHSGGADEPPLIVHSEILVAPGMISFEKLKSIPAKEGFSLALEGVHTYESTRKISCKFHLLPDKTSKTISPCG